MAFWYLNGRIVSAEEAAIAPNDIGFLRGYGVFEVIRTFARRPFLLAEHLERLEKSAAFMRLCVPATRQEIERAVNELIAKNGIAREAQIRIVLTGGPTNDGMTYNDATPTLIISVTELPEMPQEYRGRGVQLITAEYQRQTPRVKTLDYALAVRMYPEVRRRGGFEVLYVHNGAVLEAATSNVFLVTGEAAATPGENILLGTTRNYVIGLLRKHDMPVEERIVRQEELAAADEMFLTATNKDVLPVTSVDGRAIGSGSVGPLTRRVMELFAQNVGVPSSAAITDDARAL